MNQVFVFLVSESESEQDDDPNPERAQFLELRSAPFFSLLVQPEPDACLAINIPRKAHVIKCALKLSGSLILSCLSRYKVGGGTGPAVYIPVLLQL